MIASQCENAAQRALQELNAVELQGTTDLCPLEAYIHRQYTFLNGQTLYGCQAEKTQRYYQTFFLFTSLEHAQDLYVRAKITKASLNAFCNRSQVGLSIEHNPTYRSYTSGEVYLQKAESYSYGFVPAESFLVDLHTTEFGKLCTKYVQSRLRFLQHHKHTAVVVSLDALHATATQFSARIHALLKTHSASSVQHALRYTRLNLHAMMPTLNSMEYLYITELLEMLERATSTHNVYNDLLEQLQAVFANTPSQ